MHAVSGLAVEFLCDFQSIILWLFLWRLWLVKVIDFSN
jgi:hypothetical protein